MLLWRLSVVRLRTFCRHKVREVSGLGGGGVVYTHVRGMFGGIVYTTSRLNMLE